MRITYATVTAALALVATALAPVAAGAAPAAPVVTGPATVAEAPDFASEVFADPWDYANVLDQRTDDEGPILGTDARAEFAPDDRLHLYLPDGGHAALVFPGISGDLPAGRDGTRYPVDAGRYTHIALRMRVPETNPGGILFHTCPAATPSCQTLSSFFLEAGWHTFIVDLSATPEWTGRVYALRLLTGDVSGEGRYELDWVRLYRDTGDVAVSAEPGSTVYWDLDDDVSNNGADRPDWGLVGTASGGGSVAFPAGAYPGGTYRFYAEDGSDRSPHSEPLTIDGVPLTAITDPDEQGGDDYITATTGDPWDMSQPTDADAVRHVRDIAWADGRLHATNVELCCSLGKPYGDPQVHLRMGPAFDPVRYHRLTVTTDYDGDFSLSFECGGGMHGRLRWWHPGEDQHVSRPLVLYSDRHTYTWDLATVPATQVNDPGYARDHGWLGAPVTDVWWDANEDPCPRRWRLDDIALRADDAARGFFGIRFHDDAHDPGTTVSLFRDADRAGFDGAAVAEGLAQRPGDNVHWWWTYGVPAGTWWLHAAATDGTSTTRRYASGPVVTDGRPRVAGPDRVLTSVAASSLAFPDGAPAAVVALDRDFPDALAASAVAAAAGGPTLLNARTSLRSEVRAELARLGVTTVYLMGGETAQAAEVEQAIGELAGVTVTRLGGADRYATAAETAIEAARLWRAGGDEDAGSEVLVALGTDFPDALSASQLAGHGHRPLLLVRAGSVPSGTAQALRDLEATRVTIVGGETAVARSVAVSLAEQGYDVDRLAGTDRYATATEVADAAVAAGADPHRVTLASGRTFPDALGAGPAAVADGGVLLLTGTTQLPAATQAWLGSSASPATMVKVVGGAVVVTDAVVDATTAAAS